MDQYEFLGHYTHSLDSKNRVAVPAKFRGQIPDGKVIITRFGGPLTVYPVSEWRKLLENRLSTLDPISDKEALKTERMLYGSAFPCEIDKQGRISLSASQLKLAHISKVVQFQGLNNRFEIWDKKRWEAWQEAQDEQEE